MAALSVMSTNTHGLSDQNRIIYWKWGISCISNGPALNPVLIVYGEKML